MKQLGGNQFLALGLFLQSLRLLPASARPSQGHQDSFQEALLTCPSCSHSTNIYGVSSAYWVPAPHWCPFPELNPADSDSESQHEARASGLPGGKLVLPLVLLGLYTSAQGPGLVGFIRPQELKSMLQRTRLMQCSHCVDCQGQRILLLFGGGRGAFL